MPPLPNAERAFIDSRKLTDYCLSPDHPIGGHKARVFLAALGLTATDADLLREAIATAALTADAEPVKENEHGRHFRFDFTASVRGRSAVVRTGWVVRVGEDFPRLTTCFIVGGPTP